jgi:hypothetical protein
MREMQSKVIVYLLGWVLSKGQTVTSLVEDVKKKKCLHMVGEIVN